MKVLLLSHYYPPEVGAPQRRWDALVARSAAAGHVVTVVTSVPHYPQGRAAPGAPRGTATGAHGETVVRVPYLPYDSGRGRRLLDQVVVAAGSLRPALRARPDVVVATVPGLPTLLLGGLVARLLRVPLVVEMRDAWPDLLTDARTGPGWARRLLTRQVTSAQRRAAAVVCVSGRFAARLRERGARRVVHVPNGVDLAAVAPLPRPARPAPTYREPTHREPADRDPARPEPTYRERGGRPLRVLYAGTVGESQALHAAVGALALLPPGTLRVTVVGHGAGLAALRRVVATLPRPDDVLLLPPVAPEQVPGLLAAADTALVCLRDWPALEATVPSKLYELMAAGVHVTGVLAGEAAEVVRAAGAGHVVAPGDVAGLARLWAWLAADPDRTDVGTAPRRWVGEHADLDVLAERYLRLLGEVAG